MQFLETLRRTATKRAEYRRTVNELRNMSAMVSRDLDLDPAKARQLAHQAVYGV